jgi:hypothetical protein
MRPPDLAGIRARVLLIRGRYDWMVPVEVSIAILNHIADSRLVLLNDALSAIGDQFDARAELLDRCRYGSGASYQKAQRCRQSFLRSQWQEWQAYRLLVRPGQALQPGGTVRCFANDLALLRGALANQGRRPRRARWRGARSNPLAPSLPFATEFQGRFRLLPGPPSDVPLVSATLHLSKASARPGRKANCFWAC